MRVSEKPCPACGLPLRISSGYDRCARCRGVNHKPTSNGKRFLMFRSLGSSVPLPRPDLPNGGLLYPREVYDLIGSQRRFALDLED